MPCDASEPLRPGMTPPHRRQVHKLLEPRPTTTSAMQRKNYTALLLFLFALGSACAQVYPGAIFRSQTAPTVVPGPSRLDEFVSAGKLRLSLEDAIVLALVNNGDINLNLAHDHLSRFAVQRAQ